MEDSWHAQIYYTLTRGTKHLILHVYICHSVQTPVQNIAIIYMQRSTPLYPECSAVPSVHCNTSCPHQDTQIPVILHTHYCTQPTVQHSYIYIHSCAQWLCNSFCTRDCAQPRNLTTNHILQSLLLILCYIPTLTVSHFPSHSLSIAETSTTMLSTRQVNTIQQIPKQTT